jgi:hypothetical protein
VFAPNRVFSSILKHVTVTVQYIVCSHLSAVLVLQAQVKVPEQPQEGGREAGQLPGITLIEAQSKHRYTGTDRKLMSKHRYTGNKVPESRRSGHRQEATGVMACSWQPPGITLRGGSDEVQGKHLHRWSS